MSNLPSTQSVLGGNSDLEGLKNYFLSDSPKKFIEKTERELWLSLGAKENEVHTKIDMLNREIEKARTRWACITAKSQRVEKSKYKNGRFYEVNTFSQMTEVKHCWERPGTSLNPPDREGEVIHKFTKRSRQRMMSKARKLNKKYMRFPDGKGTRKRVEKKLPIPWFVTLTYHKNMRDPEKAKSHLNSFLQRWRRRGVDFAYFWKMEPQERGAVHFHLAMFLPKNWESKNIDYIDFNLNLSDKNRGQFSKKHKKLMKIISTDWAEVTKKVDGYHSEYSKITYRSRVTGKVTPGGREPAAGYHIDWQHLKYGTNVRKCDNWKMFLGYCYKYMKKEVSERPWGENKAGRFWGFSYNLDFEALQTGLVGYEDLKEMNRFCNALNSLTFQSLTYHLKRNAERAKKQFSGKKLKAKLARYRNTFEAQKRRYKINKDKIKKGYLMQFEIPAGKALAIREYLREDSPEKWHKLIDERIKKCIDAV